MTLLRSLLLSLFLGASAMAVLHAAEPDPAPMPISPNLQLCVPIGGGDQPKSDDDDDAPTPDASDWRTIPVPA